MNDESSFQKKTAGLVWSLLSPLMRMITDDRDIGDIKNHRIQKWIIRVQFSIHNFSGLEWVHVHYGNNRTMRWISNSSPGEYIAACSGSRRMDMNRLNEPMSMTFDSSGSLYVNDYWNHQVQTFALLNEISKIPRFDHCFHPIFLWMNSITTSLQDTPIEIIFSTTDKREKNR